LGGSGGVCALLVTFHFIRAHHAPAHWASLHNDSSGRLFDILPDLCRGSRSFQLRTFRQRRANLYVYQEAFTADIFLAARASRIAQTVAHEVARHGVRLKQ
jgi:hypothetical protein